MNVCLYSSTDSGISLRDEINSAQIEVDTAATNYKHYKGKLSQQERKIQELKAEVEKSSFSKIDKC